LGNLTCDAADFTDDPLGIDVLFVGFQILEDSVLEKTVAIPLVEDFHFSERLNLTFVFRPHFTDVNEEAAEVFKAILIDHRINFLGIQLFLDVEKHIKKAANEGVVFRGAAQIIDH